jgi:hypothetical protein
MDDSKAADNRISVLATPRHTGMQSGYSARLHADDACLKSDHLSPNTLSVNSRLSSMKRNSHLSLNNIQRSAEQYVQCKPSSCAAYSCPNPLLNVPGHDEEYEQLERTRLLRRVRRCAASQIVVGLGLFMNGILNFSVETTLHFVCAGFWGGPLAFISGLIGARCYKDPNTCNKRWNAAFAYLNGTLIYWSVFALAAYALSQDLENTLFTFIHLLDMLLVFCGDISAFFQTCVDPPKARHFYAQVPGLRRI